MKSINTSPISGMQELLPPVQVTFDKLKREIARVYHLHGFQSIETPIIDRTEVLLAKAGGDTEKQIYKVIKTEETAKDADQALRFDHTVPLARYVIQHQNDLTFPFKVTQIGRNFRGERPQKGRLREFYQCDIDIIGRSELNVAYDADVIATLYDALKAFSLPKMTIRISNRKILSGLLEYLNLQKYSEDIYSIVDHAEKVSPEMTKKALEDLQISSDNVDKITTFMKINGEKAITELKALNITNELFIKGVDELSETLALLEKTLPRGVYQADMLIVRGLDYYTGTVFETFLDDYRQIGSICSGGRYDNLTKFYSDHSFPGVGGSIGLTRLFYILNENNLLRFAIEKPLDIAIIPLSDKENLPAAALSSQLRAQNFSVDVVYTDKKIGDKLNYAGKLARFAIIVGEEEAKTGLYQIKNLDTREQIPLSDFLERE